MAEPAGLGRTTSPWQIEYLWDDHLAVVQEPMASQNSRKKGPIGPAFFIQSSTFATLTTATAIARAAAFHAAVAAFAVFAVGVALAALLTMAARGAAVSMAGAAMGADFVGCAIGIAGPL